MLRLEISDREFYDETREVFITVKGQSLQLEHSLVSLSKWESKWNKPFLTKEKKTMIETIDYVRCMTITQNVKPEVYDLLTASDLQKINNYIDLPMTATVIRSDNKKTNREIITAEILYYSMIALNIPFECQKWHLNRLITLINVCNLKSQPKEKMSKREIMNRNKDLNRARRESLSTKG